MDLPDLPPDLAFPRLGATAEDVAFSYALKRAAMRPHVVARWGWDEALQLDLHRRRLAEKPLFAIARRGRRIGSLSLHVASDHIRFGEFYLLPEHQGRGLGSSVLAHCLSLADGTALPVRLERLLWSPVGSLYARFGFVETGRSETHAFMERAARASRTREAR